MMSMKAEAVVGYTFLVVVVLCFLAMLVAFVMDQKDLEYHEEKSSVSARVLTKTEVSQFNLVMGAIGYHVGGGNGSGLLWGVALGELGADDNCEIGIMVDGKPITIEVPTKVGKELKENQTIMVQKRESWTRKKSSGEIFYRTVKYNWSPIKAEED